MKKYVIISIFTCLLISMISCSQPNSPVLKSAGAEETALFTLAENAINAALGPGSYNEIDEKIENNPSNKTHTKTYTYTNYPDGSGGTISGTIIMTGNTETQKITMTADLKISGKRLRFSHTSDASKNPAPGTVIDIVFSVDGISYKHQKTIPNPYRL